MDDEAFSMKDDIEMLSQHCKACIQAEGTKASDNGKLLGGSRCVTIRVDICGQMSDKRVVGNCYFLTMITVRERNSYVEPLISENEAVE